MTLPIRAAAIAVFLLTVPVATQVHAGGLPLIEFPVKPEAPALSLSRLDGTGFDIGDYRGRTVVINFWATWCPPCVKEMPALEAAWQRLREQGVVVVAVNLGDTPERIQRFLARRPVTFPILLDPDSDAYAPWQIRNLPTTYVVAPDGRIFYGAIGDRDWASDEILDPILSLR